MIANEYLESMKPTCAFHNWVRDEQGNTVSNTVCGKPAVAVYVTDDDRHEGVFACEDHASSVERDGDGPMFWANTLVVSPREKEQE